MGKPFIFDVFEGDTQIGYLGRWGQASYVFKYHSSYIARSGHELCMTMPVRSAPYVSEKLHPFFTNYISEGWLHDAQKKHLEGNLSPITKTADMMAQFGSCFGALEFRRRSHVHSVIEQHDDIEADGDYCLLENKILEAEKAMIPGAQPKVLVVATENPDVFCLASEQQTSTHIAKLPDIRKFVGVIDNEMMATRLVKHLLPDDQVCEMQFGKIEGVAEKVLIIKRFDRTNDGGRLPFYEFNQLLGKSSDEKYSGSYGEMADYIYERSVPGGKNGVVCDIRDVRKLFRRVLASLLIGNTDAHFKNFALKKEKGKFRLTPNYDLVSSIMYRKNRFEKFNQVALDVGGMRVLDVRNLDAKRIIMLANEFQIRPEELVEDIHRLEKRLKSLDKVFETAQDISSGVKNHLKSMVQKRWNGGFAGVEALLEKNPPQNIFSRKKTRELAEEALKKSVPTKKYAPMLRGKDIAPLEIC